MIRILSVSYDAGLLASRQLLLQSFGYEVLSVANFKEALQHCNKLIVYFSVPLYLGGGFWDPSLRSG